MQFDDTVLINDACPPATRDIAITLETSDGGSIAGAPFALYAPVAAQVPMVDPYLEGTVADGNRIVVSDLNVGTYRLTVTADGYEPVDVTLTVEAGEGPESLAISVTALQVSTPTPTPAAGVPIPRPTPASGAPNPTPTLAAATPVVMPTEPQAQPTTTPPAVAGLPNTGSGISGGQAALIAGFALVALAGLAALQVGAQRRTRSR